MSLAAVGRSITIRLNRFILDLIIVYTFPLCSMGGGSNGSLPLYHLATRYTPFFSFTWDIRWFQYSLLAFRTVRLRLRRTSFTAFVRLPSFVRGRDRRRSTASWLRYGSVLSLTLCVQRESSILVYPMLLMSYFLRARLAILVY